MIRYRDLTLEDKNRVTDDYKAALSMGATDPLHAMATAAHSLLERHVKKGSEWTSADQWRALQKKVDRAWNGPVGTEYCTLTLYVLVFNGTITIDDPRR